MLPESSPQIEKVCTRCQESKLASTDNFSAMKRNGSVNWHSWCKACCAASRRDDRSHKAEHYAELERKRYEKHREKRLSANRIAWAKNTEKNRTKTALRRTLHGAKYNAARRLKIATTPHLTKARSEAHCRWREQNKEQVSAARKTRWDNAPRSVKLRSAMGSAIYHSLKRGAKGGAKWQDLVGYTAVDLMRHMERQFVDGMSWDNYGAGWHIDHIVPVSSFQIESPQDNEFQQCWALSNLRPLWARENLVKHAKRLYLL